MHQLAGGDLLKMESVSSTLLDEAFTYLSFELDKSLQESIKIDADNQRY